MFRKIQRTGTSAHLLAAVNTSLIRWALLGTVLLYSSTLARDLRRNIAATGLVAYLGQITDARNPKLKTRLFDQLGRLTDSGDHRAQFWLAFLYALEGEVEEAARQASSDKRELAFWLTARGVEVCQLEGWVQSATMFQVAAILSPGYSPPHFYLGRVYQEMKQTDRAIAEYERALSSNDFDHRLGGKDESRLPEFISGMGYPNPEQTVYWMCESQISGRRWDKAWRLASQFVRRWPNRAEGYYLAGRMLYLHVVDGNPDQPEDELSSALESLRTAAGINCNHHPTRVFLGRVYCRQGKWSEARAEYERALLLSPADASSRLELGVTLLNLGQFKEALFSLDIARQLSPRSISVWTYLGDVYFMLGKETDARDAYLTALRIDPDFSIAKEKLSRLNSSR